MSIGHQYALSRRGFCICCAVATGFIATRGWLSPSRAYAEARNVVDLIRDDAAKAPIKLHKLRRDVSILEGSGGNIAVLTGADGKVFIDAGITASRPRILDAANSLSRDPIRHLERFPKRLTRKMVVRGFPSASESDSSFALGEGASMNGEAIFDRLARTRGQ